MGSHTPFLQASLGCGQVRIRDLPGSPVEERNRIIPAAFFDRRDAAIIVTATAGLLAVWLAGWTALAAGIAIALVRTSFVSRRISFRKVPADLYKAIPTLLMPIFVTFMARGGIVAPTEISVFAVVFALIFGAFIYRDLTLDTFRRCVLTTGMMTGVIMLVIMGSSVLQWILSYESVPENLAAWILETLKEPWAIIVGMNVLMIVIGTFLELPAAVLLLAPIFIGVAPSIGIDSLQLGIMMVVNLAIGLYTPSVGTTLFVSVAIERVQMGKVVRHVLPFYLAALLVLALVSFVPGLVAIFL
ncbi:MAG: TRAP transporter large permease subunit [Boseongicola sp. SB0667_bin_21]|nr:TRAP transporter large permease subunit [Boseongicola sp. SB0667_bin_21]